MISPGPALGFFVSAPGAGDQTKQTEVLRPPMSAGHAHTRVNAKHPRELEKLLANRSMRAMMARRYRVVEDRDIPDLGGYSVLGDVYYLDRDFAAALRAGEIRIAGVRPAQIRTAVLMHEHVEKCLLDADNNIDTYLDAHEFATCAEHEYVRSIRVKPLTYERGLRPIIDLVQHKQVERPPRALACAPYLGHPDANDTRVLAVFRRLGVTDARKSSKISVDYRRPTGADRCASCANWQGRRDAELATCAGVDGLVRRDRWCRRFARARMKQS
jgi:hypothetical protein